MRSLIFTYTYIYIYKHVFLLTCFMIEIKSIRYSRVDFYITLSLVYIQTIIPYISKMRKDKINKDKEGA